MKVVIAGGSGFLGSEISKFLKSAGYEVVVLSRSAEGRARWDGATLGPWVELLQDAVAVVNLSGLTVSKSWTPENRRKIIDSRVESSRAIGLALQKAKDPPPVWINASAAGYYGSTGERDVDEGGPAGTGFLAEVCGVWEEAVRESETPKTRKTILRFGVVLGNGSPLKVLAKITRWGLGGAAGSGNQWMSWIHVGDLCRLVRWAIEHPSAPSVVNACSPNPVRNRDFMSVLRKVLRRPWSPPAPRFVMSLVGRMIGMEVTPIFDSCRALPRAATALGFEFEFPEIEEALGNILKPKTPV